MHVLNRNKVAVWYALKTGKEPILDENGLRTGEYKVTYGAPTETKMVASISSGANNLGSQGMVELHPYGITTAYTHRLTTDDMHCPIDEENLIWFGITPGEDYKAVRHNFVVVRKAKSLNHLIYYIKEVDVQ